MTEQEIGASVRKGYPGGVGVPLFVSQHGEHALVLLETGSGDVSYPYFSLCRLVDGEWREVNSANFSGWYQTDDDAGVVVFWDDAAGLDEPIEVVFKGERWPAQTNGGVFWAVWWDELDPSNYIAPQWPEVATRAD